jgi:hypothetical protein
VTLSLVAKGTTAYRVLLSGAYRPVGWSADSRTIYAVRNGFAPAPETLLAVDVGGGPPRPLVTLPGGYAIEDVSADGHLVIASELHSRSDTWTLPLSDRR